MASAYIRTPEWRAALAERNKLTKRKFPKGFDSKSRLYRIWKAMHFRCYQESHEAYARYSARGITVCDEWRNNYGPFCSWALENGYREDLTLDRRDNNLGYTPNNCRWIPLADQNANRSDNLPPFTAFGETKSLKEWSVDNRCIVSYQCLWHRIRIGREIEWALLTPQNQQRRRKPMSQETKDRIGAANQRAARLRSPAKKARIADIHFQNSKKIPRNATTGQFQKSSCTEQSNHPERQLEPL